MFAVQIDDPTTPVGRGTLRFGHHTESFECVFEYWTAAQYRQHWTDALGRLVAGSPRSALITSLTNPRTANFLIWWPLYRVGAQVFIQNQALLLDELQPPFDLTRLDTFVPERQTRSSDGSEVSEWSVALSDIEAFLNSVCPAGRPPS